MDGVAIQEFTMESVILPEVFDRLRQATAKDPAVLVDLCREYIEEARKTLLNWGAFLVKDAGHFVIAPIT